MISAKVEIEPGRSLPQLPIARRNDIVSQTPFLPVGFEPVVCLNPDTLLLIRIDFAPALITSAAGAISLALRALRHGTDEADIKEGTITTIQAVEENRLRQVLQEF